MDDHRLSAGAFKATCLKVMDEVAATRREVVITKRGKPVAKLVPYTPPERQPLFGALAHCTPITGDIMRPVAPGYDVSARARRVTPGKQERRLLPKP